VTYTQELACLARRAARLECYIDITEPEPACGDNAGPFALRCAWTGYDAHVSGVNLELLREQIAQIEAEYREADRLGITAAELYEQNHDGQPDRPAA
jgi:hypothetical protein